MKYYVLMYLDPAQIIKETKSLKWQNYNNQIKTLIYVCKCVVKMSFSNPHCRIYANRLYLPGRKEKNSSLSAIEILKNQHWALWTCKKTV